MKWSTLAILGVSAYFLGYFWSLNNLGDEKSSRTTASEPEKVPASSLKSEQAAEPGQLK